jgi:transcriptional regulator with XRE-family HTH domain
VSKEEFAQRVRDARGALGFTQEDMATRLGVTAVTVSRWERAAEVPRDAEAILLAVAQLKVKARLVSLLGHAPEGYPVWAREIPVGTPFWYFENEHGEPWVARRDGRTLRIAGGDLGWREVVVEGSDAIRAEIARMTERPDPADPFAARALGGEWILNTAEAAWVLSVLLACANPVRYAESWRSSSD